MSEHPTILELELGRRGEAGGEVEDHVAACAACRAEVDFLERLARDQLVIGGALAAPAGLDEEMAALASGHAARVRAARVAAAGRRRRLARVAPWAAAAAAVALVGAAGVLWRGGLGSSAPAAKPPTGIGRADDVNRDGRVDVLDAFALARAVDAGDRRSEWDVNRDGAVDDGDVDAVALAAVSLGGGWR